MPFLNIGSKFSQRATRAGWSSVRKEVPWFLCEVPLIEAGVGCDDSFRMCKSSTCPVNRYCMYS